MAQLVVNIRTRGRLPVLREVLAQTGAAPRQRLTRARVAGSFRREDDSPGSVVRSRSRDRIRLSSWCG
jgi:hypothetical protein